jgi:hypothetical protein
MDTWRIEIDLCTRRKLVSSFTPCRFTLQERTPGTHRIWGWVGPRIGLDTVEDTKTPHPAHRTYLRLFPCTAKIRIGGIKCFLWDTNWIILYYLEEIHSLKEVSSSIAVVIVNFKKISLSLWSHSLKLWDRSGATSSSISVFSILQTIYGFMVPMWQD